MSRHDKVQFKLFYTSDPAYGFIYYAITLSLLCLSIIISCELTKVSIISIILGIIFLGLIYLPFKNYIYLREDSLYINSIWKRKRINIFYDDINSFEVKGYKFILKSNNKNFSGYFLKKDLQILKYQLKKDNDE